LSVFVRHMGGHVTDRQRDRQTELCWLRRAIAVAAVARKNIPQQHRWKTSCAVQLPANWYTWQQYQPVARLHPYSPPTQHSQSLPSVFLCYGIH